MHLIGDTLPEPCYLSIIYKKGEPLENALSINTVEKDVYIFAFGFSIKCMSVRELYQNLCLNLAKQSLILQVMLLQV